MKKNVLRKGLKLQLHSETLRTLEDGHFLAAVVGGLSTATSGVSPYPCFNQITHCACP
jgi:hypothetical protein